MLDEKEVYDVLSKRAYLELVYWSRELNYWRFPVDFPISKPVGFDDLDIDERYGNQEFQIICKVLGCLVPHTELCRFGFFLRGESNSDFNEWLKENHDIIIKTDSGDRIIKLFNQGD